MIRKGLEEKQRAMLEKNVRSAERRAERKRRRIAKEMERHLMKWQQQQRLEKKAMDVLQRVMDGEQVDAATLDAAHRVLDALENSKRRAHRKELRLKRLAVQKRVARELAKAEQRVLDEQQMHEDLRKAGVLKNPDDLPRWQGSENFPKREKTEEQIRNAELEAEAQQKIAEMFPKTKPDEETK